MRAALDISIVSSCLNIDRRIQHLHKLRLAFRVTLECLRVIAALHGNGVQAKWPG